MKRSKLKNKANRTKDPLDIMNYKKQRNYVTKLNKTAKLEYFNNLKLRKDNKPFWEKCELYFTNKHSKEDTDIMLKENGELLLKDEDAADTFNKYFGSIVESLDLYKWESEISDLGLNDSNQDYLDITICKCEKHPSIQIIKQNFRISKKFSFQPVSKDEVKKIIKYLKNSKSVGGEIPTKILQECEFTFEILTQCVNKSFASREFPDCLKQANVSPIFKKDDPLDRENYRPISILPLLSKVYEKLLYNRLSDYVENIFNVILCGFRKAHNTQHTLFKLLQSWQKELDEKSMVATVLIDLSKPYDCIPHDLLIAKLSLYGIDSY